jgi:hypothetical protein
LALKVLMELKVLNNEVFHFCLVLGTDVAVLFDAVVGSLVLIDVVAQLDVVVLFDVAAQLDAVVVDM